MIIVGSNLRELIAQYGICDESLFDESCISIKLDRNVFLPNEDNISQKIEYGIGIFGDFFKQVELNKSLTLKAGEAALCCSDSKIAMPNGYMGMVQTKGTLARLFVSAVCSDSQVDPGFVGKITLELINFSPFKISIPVGSIVANLYILKCSTTCKDYKGKYGASEFPTKPKFM